VGALRFQILDAADRVAIDEATRVLLEETGASVRSAVARATLARSGAAVEPHGDRVRFPEPVVREALRSAPRVVVLASRDGKRDLRLPDGKPHITTDGCGVQVRDLETGERRPSTTKDLADLTRVADALDVVDVQWPMCVAGDVPREIHNLVEGAVVFENTTKNVQAEAVSASDAKALVAMAAEIAGGPKELRRRPVLSSVQCPVSPLILEAGSTDGLIVLAQAGVPVVPISMVLLGGSSPVDLASAIVLANAENLASMCVAQAAAAGAPVIYGVSSGPIDMRTGSYASGSPESALLEAAGAEMARHYGLPCLIGGFGCDADDVGFQGGAERMGNGLIAMLEGADLIAGIGGLETDSTMSAEQLVLDADLIEYARKAIEGVRVDADTVHLDMLQRLGPGGNYLKERHTLANFRKALWSPGLLLREGHVAGLPSEARLRARAKARASELLKAHRPDPLPEDVRRTIWDIAEGRRR